MDTCGGSGGFPERCVGWRELISNVTYGAVYLQSSWSHKTGDEDRLAAAGGAGRAVSEGNVTEGSWVAEQLCLGRSGVCALCVTCLHTGSVDPVWTADVGCDGWRRRWRAHNRHVLSL